MKQNAKVGSEVTFLRRYNLGSYEHAEYSITKPCAEGEEAATLIGLKGIVESVHGETAPANDPEVGSTSDTEEVAETSSKKKASKKRGSVKSKPAPEVEEDETEEDEDVSVAEDEVEEDTEEEQEDEEAEEEVEEEEEAPAPKKKKAVRSKHSTYDRTDDVHKKLFGDAITSLLGKGWSKKPAVAAKAKKLSAKLNGKAFQGGDGKVLPSFIAEVKKGMK